MVEAFFVHGLHLMYMYLSSALAIVNGEILMGPPRPPSYPRTQFHMTRTAAHVTVDPSGAPGML